MHMPICAQRNVHSVSVQKYLIPSSLRAEWHLCFVLCYNRLCTSFKCMSLCTVPAVLACRAVLLPQWQPLALRNSADTSWRGFVFAARADHREKAERLEGWISEASWLAGWPEGELAGTWRIDGRCCKGDYTCKFSSCPSEGLTVTDFGHIHRHTKFVI